MIQSLRDAEIEIRRLQDSISQLTQSIKKLSTTPTTKDAATTTTNPPKKNKEFVEGYGNLQNIGSVLVTDSNGTATEASLFLVSPGGRLLYGTITDDGVNLVQINGATKITGALAVTGSVTLSSPLSVANGGIGLATITSGRILSGNGTGAVSLINGVDVASQPVVVEVLVHNTTIQYKDHAGVNQTQDLVDYVTVTDKTADFTKGVLTSLV